MRYSLWSEPVQCQEAFPEEAARMAVASAGPQEAFLQIRPRVALQGLQAVLPAVRSGLLNNLHYGLDRRRVPSRPAARVGHS